jgi:hypothetical protein
MNNDIYINIYTQIFINTHLDYIIYIIFLLI